MVSRTWNRKRLFVPPQAIGEHSPGPGIGQNVFNDAFVQFGELMDKAGAGLNVIDLLVVAFPEGFAELRLHLGHAGFPQFIKFQVDLSQKGFQAGNTAVRGQGVQLGRQKGLDAGVRLRRDPGDIFAQGRLPFLELLPGQKADGLIVCQAILPGRTSNRSRLCRAGSLSRPGRIPGTFSPLARLREG